MAVNRSLTFNELKAMLKTTDGNVSVHARRLEEADYIACMKSFDGRLPKTEYRLTASGRKALERYLNHMEALIRATREGQQPQNFLLQHFVFQSSLNYNDSSIGGEK